MSASDDSLKHLTPEPIQIGAIDRRNSDLSSLNDIKQKRSSFLIPALLKVQKYSSVSFSVFAFLHGSSVVLAPVVSVGIADELISMTRTIYQAPGLESVLIWGSLSLHICSGIILRLIRVYRNRSRGNRNRSKKGQYVTNDSNKKLPSEYGLGGITGVLGLGAKKSIVAQYLGLSPLSFSGYALIPILGKHIFQERLVPLMVDGDSSFISLSYISHLLHNQKVFTYAALTTLVWVSSYHIISGWMRYLNYYSGKSRKVAYVLINGLTAAAVVSLSNISHLSPAFGFVAQKFNSYMTYKR